MTHRRHAWVGPLTIAATTLAMLIWTWGTWPDLLTDSGRELYIPWQLTQGKRLYADLAYFNGPLSPYVNSLWFRSLGVSLRSLEIGNFLVLGGVLYLLHRLLREIAGELATVVACVMFMALFAFGQFVPAGNYNFMCPYSHELTHGLLLALVALAFSSSYRRHGSSRSLTASGLALGLCFLTKAEVFLAAGLATITGVVASGWLDGSGKRGVRACILLLTMAAVPPLLAFLLLWRGMPASEAALGVLGTWPWVLTKQIAASPFYRSIQGTQAFAANLTLMLRWALLDAVLVGVLPGIALVLGKRGRESLAPFVLLVFATLVVGGALSVDPLTWPNVVRPLPVAIGVMVCSLVWTARARRRVGQPLGDVIPSLSWSVFSLVLLGKMLFNVRLGHYGFVLAMPATLLSVVALVDWLPRAVAARGAAATLPRSGGLLLLVLVVLAHLLMQHTMRAASTYLVGAGADGFYAGKRALVVNQALHDIEQRLGPDETLAAFPDATMVNFLARRRNPSPYLNLMPLELSIWDEDSIVGALDAAPPDYVALVHKDTTEYGYRFFGKDYGRRVGAWIEAHYREVALFGARPFLGDGFGILLLRRVPPWTQGSSLPRERPKPFLGPPAPWEWANNADTLAPGTPLLCLPALLRGRPFHEQSGRQRSLLEAPLWPRPAGGRDSARRSLFLHRCRPAMDRARVARRVRLRYRL